MSGPTTPSERLTRGHPEDADGDGNAEFEIVPGGSEGDGCVALVGEVHAESEGECTEPHDPEVGEQRPLTNGEERWIEGLVRQLIYRSLAIEVGGKVNSNLTKGEYSLDTTKICMTLGRSANTSNAPGDPA